MARTVQDLKDTATAPVITLTPGAHTVVIDAIGQEPDPEQLALWLEVSGVRDGVFAYDLYFQALADAADDDAVSFDGDLAVVVPAKSIERLTGARLEWAEEGEVGLVLVNPNTPPASEAAPGVPADVLANGLSGAVAARVAAVLEQIVNPSIAAHGGRADLVAMDESEGVAYLRLSGGCQGCAMSRMTLTQGIEVALRDEVPEVKSIVDVTDHASGENPYA
jgi:Fe/S biogenesis protein NfuA